MVSMIRFPSYTLDIKITLPQLAVESKRAELDIQMEPSAGWRQLHILDWRIIPKDAYIEINNDAFRAEHDLEQVVPFTEKLAGESRSTLASETAWRAKNGDMCYFAKPHDMRPVMDYAMHYFDLQDAKAASYNVALGPRSSPQIIPHVDPAQKYEVAPLMDSAYSFSFNYTPAQVRTYLAVQPELQIKAIPHLEKRV